MAQTCKRGVFFSTFYADDLFCGCMNLKRFNSHFQDDFESRRTAASASGEDPASAALETSIFMDDIMNNGMTFCSIM